MIINPIDLVVDGLREYAGKGKIATLVVGAVVCLPVAIYATLVAALAGDLLEAVVLAVALIAAFAAVGHGLRTQP